MNQEYQIAEFLRIANKQLTFCEEIAQYPQKSGRKNYDPTVKVDNFYKSTCNAFFNDTLLIIGSLLSRDPRTISLWNWIQFVAIKKEKLEEITARFEKLKPVRNQVVAH